MQITEVHRYSVTADGLPALFSITVGESTRSVEVASVDFLISISIPNSAIKRGRKGVDKILVVGHSFTFDAKRWFFSIEHSIEGDFYPVRDCQRERRKQLEYIEGRGSIGKGKPTTGGHGGAGHAGNVDTSWQIC